MDKEFDVNVLMGEHLEEGNPTCGVLRFKPLVALPARPEIEVDEKMKKKKKKYYEDERSYDEFGRSARYG